MGSKYRGIYVHIYIYVNVYHVKPEKTRVRRIKRNGLPKLGPHYEPNGKTKLIL
jgi:hypothetical protein